jgi:ribonucleotide reductase alpha subunit
MSKLAVLSRDQTEYRRDRSAAEHVAGRFQYRSLAVRTTTGKLVQSATAYEHPQPHACFIQSIADDLVNEGGIMDLGVGDSGAV